MTAVPAVSQLRLRLQVGQHAGSALHAVADLHVDAGRSIEQYIHARSELDQAHALAALQPISNFGIENDAPRQQARNLLEDDGLPVAFHGNDILLVQFRGSLIHGVQILAALVAHIANHARNRRAVHVHIEHAEENAEPRPLLVADGHG